MDAFFMLVKIIRCLHLWVWGLQIFNELYEPQTYKICIDIHLIYFLMDVHYLQWISCVFRTH